MDEDRSGNYLNAELANRDRDRVSKVLAKHGISYSEAGKITAPGTGAPVKSLQ
jgi:hypothetical protein